MEIKIPRSDHWHLTSKVQRVSNYSIPHGNKIIDRPPAEQAGGQFRLGFIHRNIRISLQPQHHNTLLDSAPR